MDIVRYPHPALRRVAKPVREVNDDIRRIAREMLDLMYANKGIGLAATQIALPIQLFVMNALSDPAATHEERVFINPRITERSGVVEKEEGCLSLPGLYAVVKRAERIRVTALGLDGQPFELEVSDMPSRIIQHETDHLHGIVFIDKLNPLVKLGVVVRIKEFERAFRRQQRDGTLPATVALEQAMTGAVEHYV